MLLCFVFFFCAVVVVGCVRACARARVQACVCVCEREREREKERENILAPFDYDSDHRSSVTFYF